MRPLRYLLLVVLAVAGGHGSAAAESTVATTDIELSLSASAILVVPGTTVDVELAFANYGDFGINGAIVDMPLPPGVDVVASDPEGVYDPVAGLWAIGAVGSYEATTFSLTLEVAPDASGAIAIVADLESFDGSFGAYDYDSSPGNDNPCEDDHAVLILEVLEGNEDAGLGPRDVLDAGVDPCPSPPGGGGGGGLDAGTDPEEPEVSGCRAGGGGTGVATLLMVLVLAGRRYLRVHRA